MKKFISILLSVVTVLTLAFSLSGCGSNKLTFTYSDGSTKSMTIDQIVKLSNSDQRTYREIESVSGSGKITDISLSTDADYTYNVPYYSYFLELRIDNRIMLSIMLNDHDEPYLEEVHGVYVDQFYVGDIITFDSCYFSVENNLGYDLYVSARNMENVQLVKKSNE